MIMHRPKRKIVNRSLEYNNGMLHEEEVALRRALHASLAKTVDDEPKQAKTKQPKDPCVDKSLTKKQQIKSKAETIDGKEDGTSKRKTDESVEMSDKKRQKKLLVKIKHKPSKDRARNSGIFKESGEKKVIRSKVLNGKKKIESEGKVKKRRRRKKNLDAMKDDRNGKTGESLAKVHVQRKFAQINPTSPKSLMLYQSQMQPMKSRAKTEDFLDFLCLRGSSHMPKSLEMFNNPCAPMSPLTDEEDNNKTSPSKTSTNEKQENEMDAKRNLVMQLSESHSSSGSSSLVSSPVSTRVQPRTVLPQFTSNHGVLTHIPTPIPYPTPPTPTKQPGFDVYGALSTTSSVPSLVPNHPRVSAVVMEAHMSPEKQGFHAVGRSIFCSKDTLDLSSQDVGETSGMVSKTLKFSPNKKQNSPDVKSPDKRNSNDLEKGSPNKEIPVVKKTPKKSLNSGEKNERNSKSIKHDSMPGLSQDYMESTNLNMSDQDAKSVPVFSPTEVEFKNPFKYIESIKSKAESFGMCIVVPPNTWQPEYCLSDEIRFTTKLQRIHCLGKNIPSVEYKLAAIKKHLGEQNILLSVMPQISGCEVDLPLMSKVVEEFGGLQQIINKRKWVKVADRLRIPKTAMDRITKLEHIYCKYLLSYDLLSPEEKSKLFDDVLTEHKQSGRQYMIKGRSMTLANFQRNAKNINDYHMKHTEDKNIEEVFWQVIEEGGHYVVVHTAELDGSAFPNSKLKPFSKSKWNLNVLPKAPGSLTRDLPDVDGITSPMLKVDMVLSAETWHTPSHDFYSMEYLHQGESKIWYSIPSYSKENFLNVMKSELNEDIDEMKNYMIPQSVLVNSGIPVYKIVQDPGQFVVKFPGAYHSSLSTGFAVSEFLSFAPLSSLSQIKTTFQTDLKSEVDHLFSWESLIVSSVREELRRNGSEDALNILIPEIKELRDVERKLKDELKTFGIVEKSESVNSPEKKSRSRRVDSGEIENCSLCNRFCFPSSIMEKSGSALCLHHGLEKVKKEEKSSDLTIASHISVSELNDLVKEAEEKLEQIRASPRKVRKRQTVGTTVSEVDEKPEKES